MTRLVTLAALIVSSLTGRAYSEVMDGDEAYQSFQGGGFIALVIAAFFLYMALRDAVRAVFSWMRRPNSRST